MEESESTLHSLRRTVILSGKSCWRPNTLLMEALRSQLVLQLQLLWPRCPTVLCLNNSPQVDTWCHSSPDMAMASKCRLKWLLPKFLKLTLEDILTSRLLRAIPKASHTCNHSSQDILSRCQVLTHSSSLTQVLLIQEVILSNRYLLKDSK